MEFYFCVQSAGTLMPLLGIMSTTHTSWLALWKRSGAIWTCCTQCGWFQRATFRHQLLPQQRFLQRWFPDPSMVSSILVAPTLPLSKLLPLLLLPHRLNRPVASASLLFLLNSGSCPLQFSWQRTLCVGSYDRPVHFLSILHIVVPFGVGVLAGKGGGGEGHVLVHNGSLDQIWK